MILVFVSLMACQGGTSCARAATAHERDLCALDEGMTLPPSQAARFYDLVQTIEDPVIRSAAIMSWLTANNQSLTPDQGLTLCQLLPEREQPTCQRRATAVHLHR